MTARYPERPLRIVVPFPPGGSTDFAAKAIAPHLQASLGQVVVVESVVGDRGGAALRELAAADSHTLMVGSVNTNAITPVFFRSALGFDYRHAVTPVSRLSDFPSLLVVRASAPATTTLGDFLADASRSRRAIRNGTDWIGSYPDIDALRLARAAGVGVTNVELPGGADGLLHALVADRVDMLFLNARTAGAAIKVGTVKPLAVVGDARLDALPGVPTLGECGFAGIGTHHWQGLFAPGATPASVVRQLHRAVLDALDRDAPRRFFERAGGRVTPSASPERFAAELDAELARWEAVRQEFSAHPDSSRSLAG
jgi:tripartite-type tricarboxylate transporter receptor subunit TctC